MSCRKQQASRTTSYQSMTIGPPNKMLSRTDPGQGVSKIKEEIPTMTLMTIMVHWISFTVSDQAILLQSACRRSHIIWRKSKMINIDSENALSVMKFDMEIAKTQYFDIAERCWRLSCM